MRLTYNQSLRYKYCPTLGFSLCNSLPVHPADPMGMPPRPWFALSCPHWWSQTHCWLIRRNNGSSHAGPNDFLLSHTKELVGFVSFKHCNQSRLEDSNGGNVIWQDTKASRCCRNVYLLHVNIVVKGLGKEMRITDFAHHLVLYWPLLGMKTSVASQFLLRTPS